MRADAFFSICSLRSVRLLLQLLDAGMAELHPLEAVESLNVSLLGALDRRRAAQRRHRLLSDWLSRNRRGFGRRRRRRLRDGSTDKYRAREKSDN